MEGPRIIPSAIERLVQDFTLAVRVARRKPAFTGVLIGALTLGIGLTTAVFSVFYGVLLRPLPFQDPTRLVLVQERLPKVIPFPINMPAAHAMEFARSEAFADTAIFISGQRNVDGTPPERVTCLRASWRLLPLLGLSPARGRSFSEREDRDGAAVALVSEPFAMTRFSGRDPVGSTLLMDQRPYLVIGVLPETIAFPMHGMQQGDAADVWVPLSLSPDERSARSVDYSYSLLARLGSGVTVSQATQAAMPAVGRILEGLPPSIRSQAELGAAITPIQEELVSDSRRLLFLLLGAVGALLLISCSNVSNLLLSRSVARRREIAVRTALGASSGRIVWQMLHENLLLFIVSGTLGALCAIWSQRAFLSVLPSNLPRPRDLHIDSTVLVFTLTVSVVTGVIFGLAPALGSLQTDMRSALQEGAHGMSAGRLIGTIRKLLVVSQIALTVVLLMSAGLLVKSFFLALDREAQLQTPEVITFGIALPREQYPAPESTIAFYRELSDRLRQVPNVTSIGLGTDIPLEGRGGRLISPDQTAANSQPIVLDYTGVEGAYFQTLAVPLLAGRLFDAHDRQGGELVAIVNEAFGRTFWPGRSAVDHRFKIGPPSSDSPWIRVVGVVGNVSGREAGVIAPHAYVPLDQEPLGGFKYQAAFVLRTSGPALNIANVVRNAVQSLDPALPILRLRTMEQVVSGAVAPRSANARLVALFGIAALVLSALGIYGVVAYSVSERTREIGIRLALGAARSTVWRWAAWEGVRLALIGLALGLPAALAVGSVIRTLLYGVSPQDASTLLIVALAVGLTSLAGTLIPSWRAMRVDPMIAVRND